MCRQRQWRRGLGLLEDHAFASELIKRGRVRVFEAIRAKTIGTRRVERDEHDVPAGTLTIHTSDPAGTRRESEGKRQQAHEQDNYPPVSHRSLIDPRRTRASLVR
jgi:hypothetical protein